MESVHETVSFDLQMMPPNYLKLLNCKLVESSLMAWV